MELNRAETMATELMGKFGLFGTDMALYEPNAKVNELRAMFAGRGLTFTLNKRWHFKFDTAQRRFGLCSYRRNMITLSGPLTSVNDEAEVRNTILHEIAHALCPTNAGHGPMWKAMARAVGARPVRCYSYDNVATISASWAWDCKFCRAHREVTQRRRPDESVCMNCFNKAKASGTDYNIGAYYIAWRKVSTIVVPPKLGVQPAPAPPLVMAAAACAPAPESTRVPAGVRFNPARAVELFQAGHKIVDIAVGMGYQRGHGQNRVRTALIKAGVYR